MKRFFQTILLTICLTLMLVTSALAAEDGINTDAKEYYRNILQSYQNQPIDAYIQIVANTPLGKADIKMNVVGIAPQSNVFKTTMDMNFEVANRGSKNFNRVIYYEQVKNKVTVYSLENNKWFKKSSKAKDGTKLYDANKLSPDELMAFVKSVEFVNNNADSAELKLVFDFGKLLQKIETIVIDDPTKVRTPSDKDDILRFCALLSDKLQDWTVYYHIDKKTNELSMDMDCTDIIRDVLSVTMDAMGNQIPDADKKFFQETLAASNINIKTYMKVLDKPEIVTVPEEVKHLAKEVKPLKKPVAKPADK